MKFFKILPISVKGIQNIVSNKSLIVRLMRKTLINECSLRLKASVIMANILAIIENEKIVT
jgi:hypothetical protein